MASFRTVNCPGCKQNVFWPDTYKVANYRCSCGQVIANPFMLSKLPGLSNASPLQPNPYPNGMSPTVQVTMPPEPPAAPVYQKILTHAGREYRIGQCEECDREKTILSGGRTKFGDMSGMCITCLDLHIKELDKLRSAMVAAKAGGTYGEKKVKPENDLWGKTINWQYFGKPPGTP